jgi:hypothetical protein
MPLQRSVNKKALKRVLQSFVASPGIEPGSGASETLILSIVLRGPGGKNSRTKLLLLHPGKYLFGIVFFTKFGAFVHRGGGSGGNAII